MAKIIEEDIPEPTKRRRNAVTDEQLGRALILSGGIQSHAADLIKISHSLMCDRVKTSPYLQKIIQLSYERFLDDGESSLMQLVKEKNLGAICFLLKTKGKTRGYSENVTISVPAEVAQNLHAMLKQMEDHQKALKIADMSLIQE